VDPGTHRCSAVSTTLSENEVYSENCQALQEGLFSTCCTAITVDEGGSDNSTTVIGVTVGAFLGIGLLGAFLMWWKCKKQNNVTASNVKSFRMDDSVSRPESITMSSPSIQPVVFNHTGSHYQPPAHDSISSDSGTPGQPAHGIAHKKWKIILLYLTQNICWGNKCN
jgi:hypothetical protein